MNGCRFRGLCTEQLFCGNLRAANPHEPCLCWAPVITVDDFRGCFSDENMLIFLGFLASDYCFSVLQSGKIAPEDTLCTNCPSKSAQVGLRIALMETTRCVSQPSSRFGLARIVRAAIPCSPMAFLLASKFREGRQHLKRLMIVKICG